MTHDPLFDPILADEDTAKESNTKDSTGSSGGGGGTWIRSHPVKYSMHVGSQKTTQFILVIKEYGDKTFYGPFGDRGDALAFAADPAFANCTFQVIQLYSSRPVTPPQPSPFPSIP